MAGQKFVRISAGKLKELAAIQTSAGAADAGKIPALDAAGLLDVTMMPVGVGPQTASITASEALASGDFVNIWDDSGTPKVRKADATTTGKEANGFVLAAVLSGAAATVFFNGNNTGVAGKTGGTEYFLSATAGLSTAVAPSTAGQVVQSIGKALSATAIAFNPLSTIELV